MVTVPLILVAMVVLMGGLNSLTVMVTSAFGIGSPCELLTRIWRVPPTLSSSVWGAMLVERITGDLESARPPQVTSTRTFL